MKKILVIGSLNTDFSISVDKIPVPGQTVNAEKLIINNGGKGANQAFTIGKLGGNVSMLGMVGNDIYGKDLKSSLYRVNVDTNNIYESSNNDTGKAFIYVQNNGENSISIIHGANYEIDDKFIEQNRKLIEDADIILIQLEIPLVAVQKVLEIAVGKMILLDPAPADKEIINFPLSNIYLLKPNLTELETLTSCVIKSSEDIINCAKILLNKGIKNVIVSLGKDGSLLVNNDGCKYFKAIPAQTIDTTAAGDSFIASIALQLSQDKSLEESISFATKVASLVVTRKGAQESIPTLEEVYLFEKENYN